MLSSTDTTSARNIQRNYREVINKVIRTKKPVIVISHNQPEVAIIDMKTFSDYTKFRNQQADWAFLGDVWERNKHLDPDKVYKDITEIVEEVRQEAYEKRKKAKSSR